MRLLLEIVQVTLGNMEWGKLCVVGISTRPGQRVSKFEQPPSLPDFLDGSRAHAEQPTAAMILACGKFCINGKSPD